MRKMRKMITEEEHQIPMMPAIPVENEIYSQNHSLFIEDKPMSMEPLRDEENQIIEGIYEQVGNYKVYKLFLGEFSETSNGIQRIINKLQNAGPEDVLEFHISSNGGSVDELIELYNLCDTIFYGRVTTFMNHAYSAGAFAFLMGTDRVVYEHSSGMFHSYSGGFGGKRQDLMDHMEHEDKRLEVFLMGTLKPYFTKKEIKKMNKGKDFWFDTEEACKRGIATHVASQGNVLSAKDYLESISPVFIKKQKRLAKDAKKDAKKDDKKELKKLKKLGKEKV